MREFVIETSNLTKKYGNNTVVSGVNMNVERGRIYGLLGRNGAGKTTIMRMLLDLTNPTDGEIKLFGTGHKENMKENYHKIGSIIETPGFYPNLNAKENLKVLCEIRGNYTDERIDEVISLVNLDNARDKKFKEYSLGMKQRLGLAATIVHKPKLLILDEPINGLDPVGIKEIRDLLISLKNDGTTILISSHILSEIENIADEIGIINEGHLVKELTKEELDDINSQHVEFKIDNLELAKEILLKNGFTQDDFEITNTLKIFSNFEKRAYLNKLFVENGINVNEIILNEDSLEDYFMKLLNGDI
ncbi:MAG: ABC transporter ATP-binding protein [Methanobacteriaceae archaeon]|nr:ABC transporter ATP-binding protein [Methanobacteriaceae archaeon]